MFLMKTEIPMTNIEMIEIRFIGILGVIEPKELLILTHSHSKLKSFHCIQKMVQFLLLKTFILQL